MKILLTGATGYLGNTLIKGLIKKRYNIYAVVRNLNNSKCQLHNKVNYINLDLKNKNKLKMHMKQINPEVIIHLAALIPKTLKNNYNSSYKENLLVTRNILEGSAKLKSIKKIIFASSISVFPNLNSDNIMYQEHNIAKPLNYYGLHKLKSEKEIAKWAKTYKKIGVILRFSGIHGFPRNSGVIYNYYLNAIKKNLINVDNPDYNFSFLFLEDAKKACIATLNRNYSKGKVSIYHIAGSEIINLRDLAFKIKSILTVNVQVKLHKNNNINYSILSNRKAQKYLEWKPEKFDFRLKENIKKWNKENNFFIN